MRDTLPPEARAEWDRLHLHLGAEASLYVGNLRATSAVSVRVFQGAPGRELSLPELFALTGRDDLLARYRAREAYKRRVRLTGLVIAGVGLVGLGYGVYQTATRPEPTDPLADDAGGFNVWMVIGGATVLVGGGVYVAGHALRNEPATAVELRESARAYNERLRVRLGGASTGVGPWLTPGGAGLAAAGRF